MKRKVRWLILLVSLGLIFGLASFGCGGGEEGGEGGGGGGGDDDTGDDDTTDDDAEPDLSPCQPDFETGIEPNTVGTNPDDTGATVWVIDNLTCEPIEGAYVNFNGEGKTTGADGKATFELAKSANTVHVLHPDYNFRSYVDVDANTFLVRLTPVSGGDVNEIAGRFYCPDGDINTLLPQAESIFKAYSQGAPLVVGLAIRGLTRDVLASLNLDAILADTVPISISIPIVPEPIQFDLPKNVWIPEIPIWPPLINDTLVNDPYYVPFDVNVEYQPISGIVFSANVQGIVNTIGLDKLLQDPFPYWEVDWPAVLNYVNIERVGLERNFKPSEASNSDIALSVPITTQFGQHAPAYPFTVNVSGVPSGADSDVISISAGEVPYRGLSLFWFGMGTNTTLGAAPKDGVLKDMQYLVFSAATDMLSSPAPNGYLSVVIKELDQLNPGDTVNVSGFLNYLNWTQNNPTHPTSVSWTPVSGADLAMIIFTLDDYVWLVTAPPDAGSFTLPEFDPGFEIPAPDGVALLVTANEDFNYNEFNELELVSSIEAISTSVENLFEGGCGM